MQGAPPSDLDAPMSGIERTLQASIALMKRKRHELQRARRKLDREGGADVGRRTHQ
ncbi:MAG TPA: hypothetical protein VF601_13325 [Beijerinckiaceae bacterium]